MQKSNLSTQGKALVNDSYLNCVTETDCRCVCPIASSQRGGGEGEGGGKGGGFFGTKVKKFLFMVNNCVV